MGLRRNVYRTTCINTDLGLCILGFANASSLKKNRKTVNMLLVLGPAHDVF